MSNYDSALNKIEVYKLHNSLLPFVGEDYDKYRILHIGESHYINQKSDSELYGIEYFSNHWWNDGCSEVLNKLESDGWVNTRGVLFNYMNGESGSYTIFTNFVKSFSKIVLNQEINSISLETKGLYKNLAFMNFFQMPSLYIGVKYWDSILKSAKKVGNRSMASKVWSETVEHSVEVLDSVIDILHPKAVVFTSISAGNAYKEYKKSKGISCDYKSFIFTSHPNTPYTWNRSLKSLEGRTGKEVMEEGLKRIFR